MSTASYDVCHIEDGIKARAAASCQGWWRINSLTLFLLWELKDNTISVCVCVCLWGVWHVFFASCQRGNNIGFGAKMKENLIFDFIFYSNIFPVTLISGSLICGLPLSPFVFSSSSLCWRDVSYSHLAGIWGELPFSVWFVGFAVMSIPALIPVALTSLQRPTQNNGGEEKRREKVGLL